MEKVILEVLNKYYSAFQRKDWKVFSFFLTEDFTYFTDRGVIQPKIDFIDFLSNDKFVTNSFVLNDLKIINADTNSTVVTYKIKFNGIYDGQEMQVNATETTLFVIINDLWKIKHCHTSNY